MLQEIKISTTAAYSDSLTAISFDNEKNVLRIQSTCSRPYFRVRLAGPTLLGMKQMHHFHLNGSQIDGVNYYERQNQFLHERSNNNNERKGGTLTEITLQEVKVSGMYDLEIIQIVCDVEIAKIDENCIPNSTGAMMVNEPQELDLDSFDNLGTDTTKTTTMTSSSRGYWKLSNNINTNTTAPIVRTRFQLDKNCSTGGNCDMTWFDDYKFENSDEEFPHDLLEQIQNRTICFLGDSHSRRMMVEFRKIFNRDIFKGKRNNVFFLGLHYPTDWTQTKSTNITRWIQYCTDIVVAVGQWALSGKMHSTGHHNSNDWIHDVSAIVEYLHSNTTASIILRSIHYIPLGHIRMLCPPRDWRMPYFVDIYNDKLRNLSIYHPAFRREAKNRFIDTNPILDQVWDTPVDFNHYSEKVGRPEALYLLNEMFRHDEEAQSLSKLDENSSFQPVLASTVSYHEKPLRVTGGNQNNGVYKYLVSQQLFLGILVWFIVVFFLPLLQRTRENARQN